MDIVQCLFFLGLVNVIDPKKVFLPDNQESIFQPNHNAPVCSSAGTSDQNLPMWYLRFRTLVRYSIKRDDNYRNKLY